MFRQYIYIYVNIYIYIFICFLPLITAFPLLHCGPLKIKIKGHRAVGEMRASETATLRPWVWDLGFVQNILWYFSNLAFAFIICCAHCMMCQMIETKTKNHKLNLTCSICSTTSTLGFLSACNICCIPWYLFHFDVSPPNPPPPTALFQIINILPEKELNPPRCPMSKYWIETMIFLSPSMHAGSKQQGRKQYIVHDQRKLSWETSDIRTTCQSNRIAA